MATQTILDFHRSTINDIRLSHVVLAHESSRQKIHLNLEGCKKITSVGICFLKRLFMLTVLNLGSTLTTDENIRQLSQLPHLATLDLKNTNVTDEGAFALSYFPALTALGLRNTKITDRGVNYLISLHPRLESLSLEATRTTDEIIPTIGSFFKGVTSEQNSNPYCLISHSKSS